MQTPGLIDLQVNGYAGVDFNDAALDSAALDHALAAMRRAGVTTCLPTLITAPEPILAERMAALDRAVANSRLGAAMVPGFHLEGPFLNSAEGFRGCHPPAAMPDPDPAMLERLLAPLRRPVLMLTLAPERPGGMALVRWAAARMLVAIGHSAADAGELDAAVAAGARLSTHLGNAMPHTMAKFRNPLFAHLAEDRLSASVIGDGIHIPPAALKVLLRAKGLQRCVLVTDATAAAATAPGVYGFAGMSIEHTADGSVRTPGTTMLAGSSLCLDQAVRNLVAWGLATPKTAIRLASDHPAALLAPALVAHGLSLPQTTVTWSPALQPIQVPAGV